MFGRLLPAVMSASVVLSLSSVVVEHSPADATTVSLNTAAPSIPAADMPSNPVAVYSAEQTIPVPPASRYAGSGGGDGWAIGLTHDDVYNVFHHSGSFTVACHRQLDATPCYSPKTVSDASRHSFATPGRPGIWIDQQSGQLYAFATRSDAVDGVVCYDTNAALAGDNPFCGFTALDAPGEGTAGASSLSSVAVVGGRLYVFNYRPGRALEGGQNALLCFDTVSKSACPSQPYEVDSGGATAVYGGTWPVGSIVAIAGRIVIPMQTNTNERIACFDPSQPQCAGQWPIAVTGYNALGVGTPFPYLTASGETRGFCFPTGSVGRCYDLAGDILAPPTGISTGIRANSPWDGPGVVLGPRVYVPNGNAETVDCYDFALGAACTGFPKFMPGVGLLYSVNADPDRPTCLWINGDNGGSQIQSFDAYTGGACGTGDIRVLASTFVVPSVLCQPATYTSLQITKPDPSAYTSGTISFQDGDANPIPGESDAALDGTGTVDLSSRNLSTTVGLPQFLAHLDGLQSTLGEVTVKLTWTGVDDPSCVLPGTTVVHPVTNHKPVANAGGPYTVVEGDSIYLDASASSDQDGDDLTFAWDLDGDGTTDSDAVHPLFDATNLGGPSTQTVSVTVCDTSAACDTATAQVTVTNVAPTAHTVANQTVFRGDDVTLTGTWNDPAGASDAPYAWSWVTDDSSSSGTTDGGPATAHRNYPLSGEHDGTFTVADKDTGSDAAATHIRVVNHPPVCTAITADSTELWPPNHEFVPITVAGGTDPDGDPVTLAVVAISQDEPVDTLGDGTTSPDAQGIGTSTPSVLEERSGTGDGRVYHLTVRGSDPSGASCYHDVTVTVPHDQDSPAIDSGVRYDSVTGAQVDPAAAPTLDDAASMSDIVTPVDASTAEDAPVQVHLEADNIGTAGVSFAALGAEPDHGAFTATDTACTPVGDGSRCTATGIYTPAPDFNGTDDFTIVAISGDTGWTTGAHITVTPVNDAPAVTVKPATFDMPEDGGPHVVHMAATDVDSPVTGLVMTVDAPPAHGALLVNGRPWTTGTSLPGGLRGVEYSPDADFNGLDNFTVAVADDAAPAAVTTKTVQVEVRPMNDAPVGAAADVTTLEDTAIDVPILATDIDSTALTFGRPTATAPGNVGVIADPVCTPQGFGSVCTSTVHYTPAPNASGPVTFNVSVSDGHLTASLPVTVTVTPVNDAPHLTVTPTSVTMNEDAAPTSLHLQAGDVETAPTDLMFSVTALPSHGTLSLGAKALTTGDSFAGPTADITYTPNPNYNGADAFSVGVTDTGDGDSPAITTTQTVPITVNAVNDPPTTSNVTAQVEEDGSAVISIASTDIDSSSLRFTTASAPSNGTLSAYAVSCSTTNGVTTCQATTTYTPKPDVNGSDSFAVNVSDGSLTARSNVAVTIRAVNGPPTAGADSLLAMDAHPATIDAATLLANDNAGPANESGQHLTVTAVQATDATHGTVSLADGVVTYTNETHYIGDASFTYTVCDDGTTDGAADPRCATGTVDVTVAPYDNAPNAFDSSVTTEEDAGVTVTFTAHDVDGDPLTFAASTPAHGTLSALSDPVCTTQADGSYCSATATYTPAANYFGSDALAFTTNDGHLTDSGSIAVTITSVNDVPTISAGLNPLTTNEDSAADDVITTADVETAAAALTVTVTSVPTHGTLSSGGIVLGAGDTIPGGTATLHYTPDADYFGTDSFTVAVTDTDDATTTLVVPVSVTAVNDAPIPGAYDATADAGTTLQIPTSYLIDIASPGPANETDQPLRITAVTTTADTHGTVSLSSGIISYTPADGYSGSASFDYTLCDSTTDGSTPASICVTGSATFNVTLAGPPPTVSAVSPQDGVRVTAPTPVTAGITPPEGGTIASWTVTVTPVGGGASTTVAQGTGTPPATLGTLDPTLLSNGTYTLTVTAVTDLGGTESTSSSIVVDGQLKLGRLSMDFHDLDAALGSTTLPLTRHYDSTQKTSGDFGYGWSLSVESMKVTTNRPLGQGGWEKYDVNCTFGLCSEAYRSSVAHFVTVRFPDGHVETFDFTPQAQFLSEFVTADFTARAGTTSTLAPLGDDQLVDDGNGNLLTIDTFDPYEPTGFILTTHSGQQLTLSVANGLEQLLDTNGVTYTITSNGISSTAGGGATYTRDGLGRITRIDALGSTSYSYSPAGDLASVTDALGKVTTFSYDGNHRLLAITGPDGTPLRQFEYDANGRLDAIIDAAGNRTAISTDADAQTQTFTDRTGHLTTVEYFDDLGDVVKSVQSADGQTRTTTMTYDQFGHQLTLTDPLGRTTTKTYDAYGDVLTSTDPLGRTTTMTYGPLGQMLTTTTPDGATTTNSYTNRLLMSTTDPTGAVTSYTYDKSGRRVSKTDPRGAVTRYGFDAAGLLASVTNPLGQTTALSYDASGHRTKKVDPTGAVTITSYDAFGNLLTETDPTGATTLNVYDDRGRLVSTTDPNGGVTTYTYDANSNMTSVTDPQGGLTTYTYDADGRQLTTTDPQGGVTTNAYNGFGELMSTTDPIDGVTTATYDGAGEVTAMTAPNGGTTSYSYDAAGELTSATDPTGHVRTATYEAAGRIATVTNPLGQTTAYAYDAAGRRTSLTDALGHSTSLEYDAGGDVTAVVDALGDRQTATYDAAGRRTSVTDATKNTTTFTYDAEGRQTSQQDAAGNVTTTEYDGAGRVTAIVTPTGGRNTYTYDGLGHLTYAADALGHATSYTYDALGRRTSTVDPLGGRTTFSYDAIGDQTSITDADGVTTTFGYDADGNPTSQTNADGNTVTWTYDAAGLLIDTTNARGETTSLSYDPAGHVIGWTNAEGNYTQKLDADGRRTELTGPDGTTSYEFDAAGHLTALTSPSATVELTYDSAGRRTSVSANGHTTTYGYDAAGRAANVTTQDGTTTYTFDPAGRTSSVSFASGVTATYDYAGYQATGISYVAGSTPLLSLDYTYDAAGNVTGRSVNGDAESFLYDAAGRLTTVKDGSGATAAAYAYDPAGNVTQAYDASGTTTYSYSHDQLTSDSNGTSYAYDADGNLVTAGSTHYAYDSRGQLISVTRDGTTTSYQRDGEGQLTSGTTAGVTTAYAWDPTSALPQLLAAGDTTITRAGDGEPIAVSTAAGANTPLIDAQGTPLAYASANGATTGTASYSPFGARLSSSGVTSPIGYTGGLALNGDLTELGARTYSSSVDRWLEPDSQTLGAPGSVGANRYAYVGDNPVSYVDPSGHIGTLGEEAAAEAVEGVLDSIADESAEAFLDSLEETIDTAFEDVGTETEAEAEEEAEAEAEAEEEAAEQECGGGRYKDLPSKPGYERHHMPANSVSPLSKGDGPAIYMETPDHRLTASWGGKLEAMLYRETQKELIDAGLFDDAIQMDIDNIQQLFGSKYDQNILDMIDSLGEDGEC